jgi:23S rRNA (guanosine2251-2'-O)-methyltransferase
VRTEILYGLHPVAEALAAGRRRIVEIFLDPGRRGGRHAGLAAAAAAHGVPVSPAPAARIAALCGSENHQGAAARVSAFAFHRLDEVLDPSGATRPGRLLALDCLQDPHNLGAVLRTALCAGVEAVVVPKDRSAPPTPAVSRISAGALEHTRLVQVVNLARCLAELKAQGLWVVGLERGAPSEIFQADLSVPLVLVLGGEQSGLRALVRRACDLTVSIPQAGPLDSLNASAAAAVALYEIRRQRLAAAGRG